MQLVEFGPARILRPSKDEVTFLRDAARKHLLTSFAPGRYYGENVNRLAQHQYKFYEGSLRKTIPLIASRNAVDFFLFQYEESAKILHGKDLEDELVKSKWEAIEGSFKRAIKHIVELMCMQRPLEKPKSPEHMISFLTGIAISSAEQMAGLMEMSGRVFSIFPDDCLATVFDARDPHDYVIQVEGRHKNYDRTFLKRIERDRYARDRFAGTVQFDISIKDHAAHLNSVFTDSFGAGYEEFIALLAEVIRGSRPDPNGFPTLFINRSELVRQIAELSKNSNRSIEIALSGFTLTPEKLESEKRVFWNPKQEHRALCRGFFLFPHETGDHLAFSSALASENLLQLVNRVEVYSGDRTRR